MLAAATSGLAAALGVSTVAAQALLATLTLGLSAAITAIIVLVSKYVSKSKEAQKQLKNSTKPLLIVRINLLQPLRNCQLHGPSWGDKPKG